MTKQRVILLIGVVVMLAYIVCALTITAATGDDKRCAGLQIVVRDSVDHRFVTARELARELGSLAADLKNKPLSQVNTDSIEQVLSTIDRIESSRAMILTDGRVLLEVIPMKPVARVFDKSGRKSYYINREGKHITAVAGFHMDVPVIQADFRDSTFNARMVLPLLDYLDSHPVWGKFTSMIKVDSPTDMIIVPVIRGHVINLGDLTDLDSKFSRLTRMYREVFPVKGWQTYDTLSLKWGGQVVATRRIKRLPEPARVEEIEEEVDINTMLADLPDQAPEKTR